MGMHPCEYCLKSGVFDNPEHIYTPSSTGDIDLIFPNGHWYRSPDMLLHYLFDHMLLPPEQFIADVLAYEVDEVKTERMQTKGLTPPYVEIGYLTGEFPVGMVSVLFKEKLINLFEKAAKDYPWAVAPKKERMRKSEE